MPNLIKNLISWINRSEKENIHLIIVAGITHREFAAIHPFADGNDRTARALATLILYQRGYDFRKLFALEDYYNRDRQKYYQEINIGPKYNKIFSVNVSPSLISIQGLPLEFLNLTESLIRLVYPDNIAGVQIALLRLAV